jgi:hypothetical protein
MTNYKRINACKVTGLSTDSEVAIGSEVTIDKNNKNYKNDNDQGVFRRIFLWISKNIEEVFGEDEFWMFGGAENGESLSSDDVPLRGGKAQEPPKMEPKNIDEVPSNPSSTFDKKENEETKERLGDRGSKVEGYPTVTEVVNAALGAPISQFAEYGRDSFAKEGYKGYVAPGLFQIGGIGEKILEMPQRFNYETTEYGGGCKMYATYRWSNGQVPKYVRDTLFDENMMITHWKNDVFDTLEAKTVGVLYPIKIDSNFVDAIGDVHKELNATRQFRAIFGGRDDSKIFSLLQGSSALLKEGENHITWLCSCLRYYFSSIIAECYQNVKHEHDGRPIPNPRRVEDAAGIQQVLNEVGDRVVLNRDDDLDYTHFLATASMKGATKYYHIVGEARVKSIYDQLSLNWDGDIVVVVNYAANLGGYIPRWVGNPILIKGYIERYCSANGLVPQLAEAYNIMNVLPYMLLDGYTQIQFPKPTHRAEIFSLILDKTQIETSVMHDSFQAIYTRLILGGYLTSKLISESVACLCEAGLVPRDQEDVQIKDVRIAITGLKAELSMGTTYTLGLINEISGLDISYLFNINGNASIRQKIYLSYKRPISGTLFKLVIPRPLSGTIAELLQSGVEMKAENTDTHYYRINYRLWRVLSALGYDKPGRIAVQPWESFMWESGHRRTLNLHDDKRQYYWEMVGEKCRLFLQNIGFSPFVQSDISVVEEEEDLDAFLNQLAGVGGNADKNGASVVPSVTPSQKRLEVESGGVESPSVSAGTSVHSLAGGSRVLYTDMDYENVDKNIFNTLEDSLKEVVHRSYTVERIRTKKKVAHGLYVPNASDNKDAFDYYCRHQWHELPGRSDGDCGPEALYQCAQHEYGERSHLTSVHSIRAAVLFALDLPMIEGEWWSQYDFTVAGSKLEKTIIVHVDDGDGKLKIVCLYHCPHTTPWVIRCKNRNHFVGLHTKKYRRGSPMSKDNLDKSGPVGDNGDGPRNDDRDKDSSTGDRQREQRREPEDGRRSGKNSKGQSGDSLDLENNVSRIRSEICGDQVILRHMTRSALKNRFSGVDDDDAKWILFVQPYLESLKDYGLNIDLGILISLVAKKGYRWDNNKYNLTQIAMLERSYNGSISGKRSFHNFTPRWIVELKQIYGVEETWQCVVTAHRSRWIPCSLMALWHALLWPGDPITIIKSDITYDDRIEGCGCLACNVHNRVFRCPKSGCDKDGCTSLMSYSEGEGLGASTILRELPYDTTLAQEWIKDVENRKRLNSCFPFLKKTGYYKANIDLGTAFLNYLECDIVCRKMWKLVVQWLGAQHGSSNQRVTSVFLYLVGNRCSRTAMILLMQIGLLGCCDKHWVEHFKEIHDEVRVYQSLLGVQLNSADHSSLMYIHLLFGRLGEDVDWVQERKKRTRSRVKQLGFDGTKWTAAQWENDVDRAMRELIASMTAIKSKPMTLKEFFDTRYEWVASGSATGEGTFLSAKAAQVVSGDVTLNKSNLSNNKRAIAEKTDFGQLEALLAQDPIQRAFSHTKGNELAKTRSIFGVEYKHYMLHSYLCKYFEEVITDPSIAIKEEVARGYGELLERREWAMADCELNSYDFADFNDQHQLATMEKLTLLLTEKVSKELGLGSDASRDFKRVGNWIAKSFLNQWALDPVTGSYYQWSGGMFSGNRATTIVNTILNRVYINAVTYSMSRMNEPPPIVKSYHTGDDIAMKMRTHASSMEFNRRSRQCKLDAKADKQLTLSGRMEYLRLMYYSNGEVRGSLCRSLASLVSGNWETQGDPDPEARAKAAWDQVAVVMRRGLEPKLCKQIYRELVAYLTPIRTSKVITKGITAEAMSIIVEEGGPGLGIIGEGTLRYCGHRIEGDDLTNSDRRELDIATVKSKLKASNAYIKHLNKNELPRWAKITEGSHDRALVHMANSTIGLELPAKTTGTKAHKERARRLREHGASSRQYHAQYNLEVGKAERAISGRAHYRRQMRKYSRYEKLKVFEPYLRYEAGYGKKNWEQWLGLNDKEELYRINESMNRSDGGWVPSHAASLIQDYCRITGIEPRGLYEGYLSTKIGMQVVY